MDSPTLVKHFSEWHRAWWLESESPADPRTHERESIARFVEDTQPALPIIRSAYPAIGWMSALTRACRRSALDVLAWPERLVRCDSDAPWFRQYLLAVVGPTLDEHEPTNTLWSVFVSFDDSTVSAVAPPRYLHRTPPPRSVFSVVGATLP